MNEPQKSKITPPNFTIVSTKKETKEEVKPQINSNPNRMLYLDGKVLCYTNLDYSEKYYDMYYAIKALPKQKWNDEGKYWEVPIYQCDNFGNLIQAYTNAGGFIDEQILKFIKHNNVSREISKHSNDKDGLPEAAKKCIGLKERWKLSPRQHQEIGFSFILFGKRIVLADEMGVGKTLQAIAAMDFLLASQQIKRIVIVCPVSIKRNIINEIEMNTDWLEHKFNIVSIQGSAYDRKDMEEEILFGQLRDRTKWVIYNYEQLQKSDYFKKLVEGAGVIADEAHKLCNPKTKQTRAFQEATENVAKVKYMIIMTGTPIVNSPNDAFQLATVARPGVFGSWYYFKKHFMITESTRFGEKSLAFKNIEQLKEMTAPFIIRRLKRECLDLPPVIFKQETVDLTEDQTKRYVDFVNKMQTMFEDGDFGNIIDKLDINDIENLDEIDIIINPSAKGGNANYNAPHFTLESKRMSMLIKIKAAIAMMVRLYQVTSGYVSDGEQYAFFKDGGAKIQLIDDILEECERAGDPVIIWTRFVPPILYMNERYKRMNPSLIYGGIPNGEKRDEQIEKFLSGKSGLGLFQIQSGGVGLNFVNCNRHIFLNRWWNFAINDQAIGRSDRFGQERSLFVHNIVSVPNETMREQIGPNIKTICQIVEQIVARKTNVSKDLFSRVDYAEDISFSEIKESCGL